MEKVTPSCVSTWYNAMRMRSLTPNDCANAPSLRTRRAIGSSFLPSSATSVRVTSSVTLSSSVAFADAFNELRRVESAEALSITVIDAVESLLSTPTTRSLLRKRMSTAHTRASAPKSAKTGQSTAMSGASEHSVHGAPLPP
jgi:hypothetical protein